MKYHLLPEYRYKQQMGSAQKRGIDWQFTFETWYDLWISSGHYNQMGNKKGQYCMARTNDSGPYSVSNVRITTTEDNHKEAVKHTRQHTSIEHQIGRYSHPKGQPSWNKGLTYDATPRQRTHLSKVHKANQKSVMTPQGMFESIEVAANTIGMNRETARNWANKNKNGWTLL
jgi:hypothetical protein